MRREDPTHFDAIKERLQTVKGAQEVINEILDAIRQSLSRPNRSGESLDNFEPLSTVALDQALSTLRYALFNLPEGVASVSVGFKFPQVHGTPAFNREYELRNLQSLLAHIGIGSDDGEFVQDELVVLPPFVPEELKGMSHGSASRSLEYDVRETLLITYFNQLNVLEIKPHGAPGGELGVWAMHAMNYRVPLAQVEYFRLDTEPKPLSPWLELVGGHELAVREIQRG